jgi:hypothetical protein
MLNFVLPYFLEKGKPKKTCYLAPPLEKVEKV